VLLCAIGLLVPTVFGQTQPHLNRPVRGGMPGLPILTGVELTTNGLRLTWEGPPGFSRIESRRGVSGAWRPVGPASLYLRAAPTTGLTRIAFFRVVGPAPN